MKIAKHRIESGRSWDKNCCSYCAGELVSIPSGIYKSRERIVTCVNCLVRIVGELNKQAVVPTGE